MVSTCGLMPGEVVPTFALLCCRTNVTTLAATLEPWRRQHQARRTNQLLPCGHCLHAGHDPPVGNSMLCDEVQDGLVEPVRLLVAHEVRHRRDGDQAAAGETPGQLVDDPPRVGHAVLGGHRECRRRDGTELLAHQRLQRRGCGSPRVEVVEPHPAQRLGLGVERRTFGPCC
jgi:hypothetical protein